LAELIAMVSAKISVSETSETDVCPLCDGYGHVITESGAQPCQCFRDNQIQRRLDCLAGKVYERYHKAIYLHQLLEESTALNAVREYMWKVSVVNETFRAKSGLFICGTTGVGKTMAAIHAIAQLIRKNPVSRIRCWLNFGDMISDTLFGGDGDDLREKRSAIRRQIDNSDAIVIDDIGQSNTYQKSLDIGNDTLKRVIDKAMGDFIPAILISNATGDELKKVFSGPVLSRLSDPFWNRVQLREADRRVQK